MRNNLKYVRYGNLFSFSTGSKSRLEPFTSGLFFWGPLPPQKKPHFHRGHYSFGPLYFPFKLTSLCRFGTEQHQRPGLDEYIVKANARFLHRKLTPFFFLVDLVPSKARIKKEKKSQVTLKLCVCVWGGHAFTSDLQYRATCL